jgi:hypothetical protein
MARVENSEANKMARMVKNTTYKKHNINESSYNMDSSPAVLLCGQYVAA